MISRMIIDQTEWAHIQVTGDDRIRFLQGMCTANIAALNPGDWTRACMLNTKGRVVSIFELICREHDLLVTCEPALADRTLELLEKHAIMDDVLFERIATPMHRIWDSPAAVWDAAPVLAPPPGPPATPEAIEVRRIEAGMPRFGVDVSEDNFPFESLLSRHIDYDKGCYLGQEPVSRVYHQGNPSKAMRGLRIQGPEPVPAGAVVSHPARAQAGTVSSSAVSPDFGSIALAYLHRSVFEPGTEVTVAGRPATVVALPFAHD